MARQEWIATKPRDYPTEWALYPDDEQDVPEAEQQHSGGQGLFPIDVFEIEGTATRRPETLAMRAGSAT